jgi:hypothetical protein
LLDKAKHAAWPQDAPNLGNRSREVQMVQDRVDKDRIKHRIWEWGLLAISEYDAIAGRLAQQLLRRIDANDPQVAKLEETMQIEPVAAAIVEHQTLPIQTEGLDPPPAHTQISAGAQIVRLPT